MSVVLDASAGVSGLFDDGSARHLMAREPLHAPHLRELSTSCLRGSELSMKI